MSFPHTEMIHYRTIRLCVESFDTTYMLFAGWEVRIGKNCAIGLEYGPRPQAESRIQDRDLGRQITCTLLAVFVLDFHCSHF